MSTGQLTAFATGIAQRLVAAGIGTWDDNAEYAESDVGFTIEAMPPSPGQIIALSPYVVSDDPGLGDSVIGLRIRMRGDRDPRTVIDREDAIFDELEGLAEVEINGVYLAVMWRQSNLPLPQPQDANQRWERSSTYYARVAWPTQHRTD